MFSKLFNYLDERKRRKNTSHFDRGYEYARSSFVGGDKTLEDLELYNEESRTFDNFDAFNHGVAKFIRERRKALAQKSKSTKGIAHEH